jgi:hypothetical protein
MRVTSLEILMMTDGGQAIVAALEPPATREKGGKDKKNKKCAIL